MVKKNLYDKFLENEDFRRLAAQEDFILDVTENFYELLHRENISKALLAKLTGKTKGFISQILNGGRNLTLRSISDLAYALGYRAIVNFEKVGQKRESHSIDFNWGHKQGPVLQNLSLSDDYSCATDYREQVAG
jgi:transcriptional regulator with XRE-family HTH domain